MAPDHDRSPAVASVAAASAAAKVAWLSDPAAYPERPRRVERIETHFAWVFLTDTHAYKLKKALRIHGADLRGLAERERCCREELRLNLRLAGETYLDVLPLVVVADRLALGGPGSIVDWLVRMRRLDLAQMLDARLEARTVTTADLEAVVRHLHRLDPAAPDGSPPLSAAAYLAGVARRLAEALHEVARPEFGLQRAAYQPLAQQLRARLDELRPVLGQRAGRVREGHGDLRAEHVWLGQPPQIIDALEFDRSLRMLDPAEDVAMLAVDAARLDGRWVRQALCAAYEAVAADPLPPRLWGFYLALRAATRAKVALWHLDDPDNAVDPAHWRQRALEYLSLGSELLADAALQAGARR